MVRRALPLLGWKELASLPEWGIPRLRAKLDTGARSSALHVEDVEEIDTYEDADGQTLPVLRFHVLVGAKDTPSLVEVEAPTVGRRVVRDTGARAEDRYVVRTRIVCGPIDTVADVTLTSRHGMNFRMLLGRLTLEGRCLVDPSAGYLQSPAPPLRRP